MKDDISFLSDFVSDRIIKKLESINNSSLTHFLRTYVELCEPESLYVSLGHESDKEYVKKKAIESKEEIKLKMEGHTIHFDHPLDQARAREDTFILTDNKIPFVNTKPREEGLREALSLLKGSMKGREMYVGFYSLGPRNSRFQILAVQITDSPYVIHSENILYRNAFEDFSNNKPFLKFIHSKGELNIKKRRIMIDVKEDTVYSVNTTYAGNSVGLKKLALRLTVTKAVREGWLSEHMAIVGFEGDNGIHYFTASFPSGSGKTSTAMLGSLISDDLAFIREVSGEVKAVNPEIGVFGIIQGINEKDDPVIWEVLHKPGEVIFSNVLMTEDGDVYWEGSGKTKPEKGYNYEGVWNKNSGKPASHPNARFTVPLTSFSNLDKNYDNPDGVSIDGIIFGVRDYSTLVPAVEAFSWNHGIITIGASMESARTSAVIGKADELEFNPMAILDFMPLSLGSYLNNYLNFGKKLKKVPKIFGFNYFLKDGNKFVNSKEDKKVWIKWAVLRVENSVDAIYTPIGFIPYYDDLKTLFMKVLGKEYGEKEYELQFSLKLRRYLEKTERILKVYSQISDTPSDVIGELKAQQDRLLEYINKYGDVVSPLKLSKD
ncbi:phosphoenolpyruvate carboxykinase [Sulfolobus sp. A20]|uniref:phosphoenolpyruvate carboxykinase (GTP) n=1 Tax=Saccharolobus sp. A20 TaxID=1891280 RepID=UPI000845CAFB|nr:phosphoenolpyruvate carboxykinase (GTP) [Sulfolobus sp. A20]TRM83994.1 phosphoenolpyruvate carboxykinase (GTP) [Sulfolobus sp. A20-N-F6]TRM89072.1 phosphoenolpyruvate carboxykinase (GTP) [Sulfolobus sp. C3]TRM94508.1 phosphoenolpyruvate carboxykinase (GTP) [Sulfolobus sp. A20-N-G8]TRM98176.1 phosphoenolpyruvate carboxykinase (GTP) [Sulfolobus sp. E1]TRN04162.1 phosphoenolpyruvate carboxykinase (GTP) [Sulfolobus sp. F1]